jgi:hypothetical protein
LIRCLMTQLCTQRIRRILVTRLQNDRWKIDT